MVIEAVRVVRDKLKVAETFLAGRVMPELYHPQDGFQINWGNGTITINTLEGKMTASEGDWIIKGVNGEFYPCKPDIFEKTYEKAK